MAYQARNGKESSRWGLRGRSKSVADPSDHWVGALKVRVAFRWWECVVVANSREFLPLLNSRSMPPPPPALTRQGFPIVIPIRASDIDGSSCVATAAIPPTASGSGAAPLAMRVL